MPMTMGSILSRPCLSGLRMRPRRLFGFDGTTDADPRSPTGSITPGAFGPAPATAPARIADPAIRDLQGVRRSPAQPAVCVSFPRPLLIPPSIGSKLCAGSAPAGASPHPVAPSGATRPLTPGEVVYG